MRIELAGSLIHPDPQVFRYDNNDHFYPGNWMQLNYTHFEVICIGGGGGMGGGIDTGSAVRNYGGAGGGGGYHRVRGLLSALPIDCAIIVGLGGALGTEHNSDPAYCTDGGDGGYSSFNGTTCQASGGKGGRRAQSNSQSVATQANGGDGGVGNRTNAGGGATGGVSGVPSGAAGTKGADGTLINNVGKGGGGGAGGIGYYGIGNILAGTLGGRGSYNPGDLQVYGPNMAQSSQWGPGGAGGAKASPLNGLPTAYGYTYSTRTPGAPGIVIVRISAE